MPNRFYRRGVAQLVERVVWDHQAAGSSPVTPTRLGLDAIRVPSSAFSFAFSLAFTAGIFFSPSLQAEPGADTRSGLFLFELRHPRL